MSINVKAHIRAGKRVRAYTRGSKTKSSQYRKTMLKSIGMEAGKKFSNPLKQLPSNPLEPNSRRHIYGVSRSYEGMVARHNKRKAK